MKKYLHISSTQPGVLIFDTEKIIIGDKKVHISTSNNMLLLFEPKDPEYESMYVSIPQETCTTCSIVPFYNNHFDVSLAPRVSHSAIWQEIYSTSHGKIKIQAYNSKSCTNIKVFLGDELKCNIYTNTMEDVSSKTNSYIIITGKCQTQSHIIVIDENFNVIINDNCMELEEDTNTLKALINIDDIVGHGKVYSFDTKNNTYSSYTVYTHNIPKNQTDRRLIPLNMLKAICANNYILAKSYFENPPSTETLKQYFGNISDAYFNTYDKDNINYTVIGDSIKSYNFTLTDNKITDIEEVSFF